MFPLEEIIKAKLAGETLTLVVDIEECPDGEGWVRLKRTNWWVLDGARRELASGCYT